MFDKLDIGAALDREMEMLAEATSLPGPAKIWFWQSNQALVAPRKLAVNPAFNEACAKLATLGWDVHTRSTGGDVTPQGPGIINATLVFVPEGPPNIPENYDRLCTPMERVLGNKASRGWNPGAFCDGEYNVQWNGLKFAGTAQRLKRVKGTQRSAVLAHALMLMKPPTQDAIDALNLFLEILGEPRQIEADRHTGLPDGVNVEEFLTRLHKAYQAYLP